MCGLNSPMLLVIMRNANTIKILWQKCVHLANFVLLHLAISQHASKKRDEQYSHNASVIKSLLQYVCFYGKQGISFRGHRDDSTCKELDERGNFMQLVDFRAQTDNILHEHLEKAPVVTSMLKM